MQPKVITWYAQGEPLPWRKANDPGGDGWLTGEVRCDSFHELLLQVAEAWSFLQPEPIECACAETSTRNCPVHQ